MHPCKQGEHSFHPPIFLNIQDVLNHSKKKTDITHSWSSLRLSLLSSRLILLLLKLREEVRRHSSFDNLDAHREFIFFY